MRSVAALTTASLLILGCSAGDIGTDPGPPAAVCIHDVYRHKQDGWLLTTPIIRFVFWGSYWQVQPVANAGGYALNARGDSTPLVSEYMTQVNTWNALLAIGPTPVLQRLAEYGIHDPVLDTNPTLDNLAVTGPIVDSTIPMTLNTEIQLGDIATPDDGTNTLYVVFLPPNVTTAAMIANGWIGYHQASSYGSIHYAYAVITYEGTNQQIVSHEIYEATTDPDVNTGYYDDARGEIADLCEPFMTTIDGYSVQKVWSQAACQCE